MWQRHRLRRRQNRETHELRYLFFEVSRRCNLSCLYCGSSCTAQQRAGELSLDEWKRIIDEVADHYDSRRIMVAITGGEPLLREDIYDIMLKLRERGFPYGMVSNATLLDDAAAKKLIACGIRAISLSMDAPPEINDKIRGKGTSDAVIHAIQHLRDNGYTGILEIISTLSKPAIDALAEMQRFVSDLGIKRWRVAPIMPIGRATEYPELIPDDEDLRATLNYVKAARMSASDTLQPEFGEEGYLGDEFEGMVRPYLWHCRAGINVAGIRYNGVLAACPEISYHFDQGDLRKEAFKDIWENRYQVFRDRSWTKKLGPCVDCEAYANCDGGAMHLYDDCDSPIKRCFYQMCK